MSFNLSAFLQTVKDYEVAPVEVPEWDGAPTLYVRTLAHADFLAVTKLVQAEDSEAAEYLTLIKTVCDQDGNLVLSEADIPALRHRDPLAILRLTSAARLLTEKRYVTLEEAKKKSVTTLNSDSQ